MRAVMINIKYGSNGTITITMLMYTAVCEQKDIIMLYSFEQRLNATRRVM